MSPVDRVPQILVAVSARPSPRPSDEVAVAVRVGPSVRPPAERATAGSGNDGRDARAFENSTRDHSRSLPPLDSIGPDGVDWEDARTGADGFADEPQWVDVAASGVADRGRAARQASAATAAYVTAGADVASMRSLLAKQRGHSAYSLAPAAFSSARQDHSELTAAGAGAAARLHVVA